MVGFAVVLIAPAVVKIAIDKLSTAIGKRVGLLWNFGKDLEEMKDTMEAMAAVLKDAEQQSVRNDSVRLWLKRLKDAALDICDMMDDYQDTDTQPTAKTSGMLASLIAARKKNSLANKMKNVRETLRKINEQHRNFNFAQSTGANLEQQHYDKRETTSVVDEAKIIGRDGEKKKIQGMLSSSQRKDGTMVLPIYGLGGIGKSTLAQIISNDTQIKQYDHRVWVYVSEVFDLKKIGNSIISQLPTVPGQHNTNTLEMVHQCLNNLLPGKKILIVLDDIWEEDDLELEKLKQMLHVDKKGSLVDVIVTTRAESIANKICTGKAYKLQPLSDHHCWDIIKRYCGFKGKSNKERLEQIGLDIATKCGGVALAAQALGYLLKSKDLHDWIEINNSDLWNESFGVDDLQHKKVLPSLKLSCERMVPIVRLCFAYCAIFPKGYDIYEDDLVHEWVALDFIKKPSEGKEIIKQLLGMSFLQYSLHPIYKMHADWYTMHDLVHDLARSVVGDELIVIDAAKKSNARELKYCRYALLTNYDGQTKLSNILPKKIRALHLFNSSKLDLLDGSFSFAKRLHILDLSECSTIILPSSIGQLKQLKCLIAPELQNERLPEAIAELSKLQYLNLRGSSSLTALPKSIGKLSCLLYLGLSKCSSILKVPEPIGGLKSLMHLDMSYCSGITSLPGSFGNLTKLQHLDLKRCSSVIEIPESLGGLSQLQHLNLEGCDSLTRLPEAIGSLINLQHLDMSLCTRIRELPGSFQNLQSLVHLDLLACGCLNGLMKKVLYGLTSLEYLDMCKISFDNSFQEDVSDAMGNLTNLKYLYTNELCPDYIGALSNLEHLTLMFNDSIVSLPECIGNLKKLHTLKLRHCKNLKYLPDSISELTALKSVSIYMCADELIEPANSKLHYSLTLPLFKVRADVVSGCSNLPLLKDTNVDELRIRSLENVRFLEEARKVKLLDKGDLCHLTLSWTPIDDSGRFVDDEDLLRQLEPPRVLRKMCLEGYSSQSFPCWFMDISHHLPNLVRITLDTLSKCKHLPPLGQLPNLEKLSIKKCYRVTRINQDFCSGKGAFRRLSSFKLYRMEGLEEWCTTYSVVDDVEEFMFPVLDDLRIMDCPRLRLKPCAPTCRKCIIESSDQVISSLEEVGSNVRRLTSSTPSTSLEIRFSNSNSLFSALQRLKIACCSDEMGLPECLGDLSSLKILHISWCNGIKSFPESMRHLTSLEKLKLWSCNRISELPEWLGDLSSLKILIIDTCEGINSLPPSIQRLTKLRMLRITGNLELERWCESEENKKKLAHINHIAIIPTHLANPAISQALPEPVRQLLNLIWAHKDLQPHHKAFACRLLHMELADENECRRCGARETVAHVFFDCSFSRAVWFSFSPPIRADRLPVRQQGIWTQMVHLIQPGIDEAMLHRIIVTLWQIRMARNDHRFYDEDTSVLQVHMQATAEVNRLRRERTVTHTNHHTALGLARATTG